MGGGRGSDWAPRASLLLLLGCQAYDPEQIEREGTAFTMVAQRDGGPAVACSAIAAERCNGRDDDCDGKIDEGAQRECRFANARAVCSEGACVLAGCDEGFLDCNQLGEDGCEQPAANMPCGACRACDGGMQPAATGAAGRGDDDYDDDDDQDAGDSCTPEPERCDELDNDCDDLIDEGQICAIAACAAMQPSYRGAACDACVCEHCTTHLDQCQHHPDAAYQKLCRDLIECFVLRDREGACGDNADCYGSGNGPCAAEVNLAAGGDDAMDRSDVNAGACSISSPPRSACSAATAYRDQCIETVCADACDD